MNRLTRKTPLRRTPLRRTVTASALKRTAMPRVNRARRKAEFARCYGGAERAAWIRQQRCVGCHSIGPCDNAHVTTGGMGRKADAALIVPLCRFCHADHHRLGTAGFEHSYSLNLLATAADVARRWDSRSAA